MIMAPEKKDWAALILECEKSGLCTEMEVLCFYIGMGMK